MPKITFPRHKETNGRKRDGVSKTKKGESGRGTFYVYKKLRREEKVRDKVREGGRRTEGKSNRGRKEEKI